MKNPTEIEIKQATRLLEETALLASTLDDLSQDAIDKLKPGDSLEAYVTSVSTIARLMGAFCDQGVLKLHTGTMCKGDYNKWLMGDGFNVATN